MPVLVAYASKHGATAEIATAIAEGLTRRGVPAEALPADTVGAIEPYEAAVLGSAVYAGHWLKPEGDPVHGSRGARAGRRLPRLGSDRRLRC